MQMVNDTRFNAQRVALLMIAESVRLEAVLIGCESARG